MTPAGALDADVAVIGAGPAGASAALFAARSGKRVLLMDQHNFPRDKPCGEGLMPSGRSPLRDLGLDGRLSRCAPPLHGAQLGLAGQAYAIVPFPRHGDDQWGLGVRRMEFDNLLIDAVRREPLIQLHENAQATSVQRGPDGPRLVTSAGELRVANVAVADGLRSAIRHGLGWTRGPRPPHRYGVVAHWRVDGPVDPWIRITFADGFELYESPVADQQRMVGLLCYQEHMRDFAGRLASRYRELVETIRPDFRHAQQVGAVSARGPFWYRASTVADHHIFLVGDAAGFTDPITGEGMATGLRQARAFAHALDGPNPERTYRLAHRRITGNPRRIASLFLRLTRTPKIIDQGVRNHQRFPQTLPKLLGVGFGYWGFERITPREWVRIFTGR